MNARVAIPYADGKIFRHFGKSERFKIYTVTDGGIASSEVLDTDGTGHDELGIWLVRNAVNAVICSDIGPGAQGALAAAGIFVFAGIEGPADEAIADLLAGKLTTAKSATCRCRAHAGGCGSDACGGCGSRGCPTHA
jgi:predicted Fe-Mo cluster-binding NifX family protein